MVWSPQVEGLQEQLSDHAGRNTSERQAGLEKRNGGADPPRLRGRPMVGKEATDTSTDLFPPG